MKIWLLAALVVIANVLTATSASAAENCVIEDKCIEVVTECAHYRYAPINTPGECGRLCNPPTNYPYRLVQESRFTARLKESYACMDEFGQVQRFQKLVVDTNEYHSRKSDCYCSSSHGDDYKDSHVKQVTDPQLAWCNQHRTELLAIYKMCQ